MHNTHIFQDNLTLYRSVILATLAAIIALVSLNAQSANSNSKVEFQLLLETFNDSDPSDIRQRFVAAVTDELPDSLRSSVNSSVDPCEDFFTYSCGSWISKKKRMKGSTSLAETDISQADEKSWDQAQNAVNLEMRQLIETTYTSDSPFKPVQDWYNSCMNESAINERGVSELNDTFALIDAIQTPEDVNKVIAHFLVWKLPTFMSITVHKSPASAFSMNTLTIDAGGRTLDSTDDYLLPKNDWKMSHVRKYITEIFTLAGYGEGAANAAAIVVDFEKHLARWVSARFQSSRSPAPNDARPTVFGDKARHNPSAPLTRRRSASQSTNSMRALTTSPSSSGTPPTSPGATTSPPFRHGGPSV